MNFIPNVAIVTVIDNDGNTIQQLLTSDIMSFEEGISTSGDLNITVSGNNDYVVTVAGQEALKISPGNIMTINNDLFVNANLIVQGTTSYMDVTEMSVSDNIITLNSGVVGIPVLDAGIEVDRGIEPKAQFLWDESEDRWVAGSVGDLSNIITEENLQQALAENLIQVLFTTGTNLNATQTELPIQASADENPGTNYSINSNNITCALQGLYRVSYSVEGQRGGGGTQRKNLRTSTVLNGSVQTKSICSGYIRDATNNHVSVGTTVLIRTTSPNQTIGIRSEQQGSGGSSTFTLSSGHLLIEYLGS